MTPGDLAALDSPAVLTGIVGRSIPTGREPPPKQTRPAIPRRQGAAPLGGRVIFAALRQQAPALTASGLITEAAASEFGFAKADVDRALDRITSDPLAWKAVLLTAEVERLGAHPFSLILGDLGLRFRSTPRTGLEFGIGFFSILNRALLPVLQRMRSVNQSRFDEIMGKDSQRVAAWLEMSSANALDFIRREMLDPKTPWRVVEPWRTRFVALGDWPEFQRVQMEEMQRRWVSLARRHAANIGLRSERAFAFVYDTIIQMGTGAISRPRVQAQFDAFARQLERDPDEQEKLLIVANVATQSPLAQAQQSRERRLAFAVGQGTIGLRPVDLLDAGFGMRDVDTGEPVPLVNDAAVVKRLIGGWLPAASTPTR